MGPQAPQIGDDVTALMPAIGADVTALMVSHGPVTERPVSTGGGRGTGFTFAQQRRSGDVMKKNAPAIGGGLAAIATGGSSLPIQALAAAAGGVMGSGVRGDDLGTVAKEGAIQGALQLGGGLAMGGLRKIAHGLMPVPKHIAANFEGVDLAQEMLDRGVLPGSTTSARRIEGLSRRANLERDAAAATVPTMPRRKIIEGLRPVYQKAHMAKEPDMAADVLDYMRESARHIGPAGLTGPEQLARKDVKQRLGKAALNATNPRTAALSPQLHDAERAAIVSHLRDTPGMESALNESQTLLALDRVMKDASHSNVIRRAQSGGLAGAAASPLGAAATAHTVNHGSQALDPQVIRALMMLLGERSNPE